MKSDISEFSFGYAITEEFAASPDVPFTGAPRFPSLLEEGAKGGYDVELPLADSPLFLQFKLSDYMKGGKAAERECFNANYFRMHLRKRSISKQHSLLLALERSGNRVFYIAPAFYKLNKFNLFYLSRTVRQNSIMLPPTEIGDIDDDGDHYVVFSESSPSLQPAVYICSKPRKIDYDIRAATQLKEIGSHTPHHSQGLERRADKRFLIDLVSLQLRILEQHRVSLDQDRFALPNDLSSVFWSDLLKMASEISRVYFGAELFLPKIPYAPSNGTGNPL